MPLTAGIDLEEERRRDLTRRRLELELVASHDKNALGDLRLDCWFLCDAQWLRAWTEYASARGGEGATTPLPPAPGPLSNARLLTWDGKDSQTGSNNKRGKEPRSHTGAKPLPHLETVVDYRGVPSLVYFILVELHGKDDSPEIARYDVDIYKPPIPVERLVPLRQRNQTTARILVDEIRPMWIKWERNYSDDENDIDDNGRHPICCCGLTREHIETIIYWAVLCCTRASRKTSGRKNISYRQYKPLKYKEGDSSHGEEGDDGDGCGDVDDATVASSDSGLELTERTRAEGRFSAVEDMGRDYHRPMFNSVVERLGGLFVT